MSVAASILPILKYPDPRLHRVAEPITVFDADLAQLAQNMLATMYAAQGVGLAATQVNVHRRLVVVDVSEAGDQPQIFINPTLIAQSHETASNEEGCLSVPDVHDVVERAVSIQVKSQNLQGEWQTLEAQGLLAICLQHEIDHLNGKVFVQHLSQLKQQRIKTKLLKVQRTSQTS